jgi:hypothetical protein|tara:strand:+ start:351 stop:563 length:213 start_codon:yes stop_codon:yes gene_type:complete
MTLIILAIVVTLVLIGFGTISENQVEGTAIAILAVPFAIVGAFLGLISLIIGLMLAYWFIAIPVALMILL